MSPTGGQALKFFPIPFQEIPRGRLAVAFPFGESPLCRPAFAIDAKPAVLGHDDEAVKLQLAVPARNAGFTKANLTCGRAMGEIDFAVIVFFVIEFSFERDIKRTRTRCEDTPCRRVYGPVKQRDEFRQVVFFFMPPASAQTQ